MFEKFNLKKSIIFKKNSAENSRNSNLISWVTLLFSTTIGDHIVNLSDNVMLSSFHSLMPSLVMQGALYNIVESHFLTPSAWWPLLWSIIIAWLWWCLISRFLWHILSLVELLSLLAAVLDWWLVVLGPKTAIISISHSLELDVELLVPFVSKFCRLSPDVALFRVQDLSLF